MMTKMTGITCFINNSPYDIVLSMDFKEMTFLYLALITLCLGIAWWIYYGRSITRLRDLFRPHKKNAMFWKNWKGAGLALSIVVLFFCLSGPTWGEEAEMVYTSGRDIYFVMDCSYSMLAEDARPSRQKASIFLALSLLNELPGARAGLISFAGRGFPVCPLTSDIDLVRTLLSKQHPDNMSNQGTSFQASLETLERIIRKRDPNRMLTVIFMSDGESFVPPSEETLEELRQIPLHLLVIGVGTTEGSLMKDPRSRFKDYIRDKNGNLVRSRLEPELLLSLAQELKGTYIQLQTAGVTSKHILKYLLKTTSSGEFSTVRHPVNRASLFGWIACIVLCLVTAGERVVFKGLSRFHPLIIICVILPLSACRPSPSQNVKDGNQFLKNGQYQSASQRFTDAMEELTPQDELFPLAVTNLTCAHALNGRQQEIQTLMNRFRQTGSDLSFQADLLYNFGCSQMLSSAPDDAADTFRNCLELNPADGSAVWNLEYLQKQRKDRQRSQPPRPEDSQAERILDSLKDIEKTMIPRSGSVPVTLGGPYW